MIQDYYLAHLNDPMKKTYKLQDHQNIGRSSDNWLSLNGETVSDRHVRISQREDQIFVKDLHSTEGVFVNQMRVFEACLSLHDILQVGPHLLQLVNTPLATPALTSRNSAWNKQLTRVPLFARTPHPVLITGPSGSGKEIVSQALHEHSLRREQPFVAINCGALSETLIESELFGHIKGSYTGATNDRKGAFEIARGGTLFLDEIGDLPLSLQPKLLRALENQEIRPVGSDRTIKTDVRIIAATHKNLDQLVRKGLFREDLYFRLNICRIQTPSLAHRMEDFDTLVYTFARKMRVKFSHLGIEEMRKHTWPGNIRELKNVVSRASACFSGTTVGPEEVKEIIDPLPIAPSDMFIGHLGEVNEGGSVIKDLEKSLIVERLMLNRGNQRKTALELGIPKSTLHDRIRTYQINVKDLVPQIRSQFMG